MPGSLGLSSYPSLPLGEIAKAPPSCKMLFQWAPFPSIRLRFALRSGVHEASATKELLLPQLTGLISCSAAWCPACLLLTEPVSLSLQVSHELGKLSLLICSAEARFSKQHGYENDFFSKARLFSFFWGGQLPYLKPLMMSRSESARTLISARHFPWPRGIAEPVSLLMTGG